MDINGFLYSQIGYDLKDPKRALIRSTDPLHISAGAVFEVVDTAASAVVLNGPVQSWGEIWKTHWWEIDFSALEKAGEYRIIVKNDDKILYESDVINAGNHLLWDETIKTVVIEQFEERTRRARNGNGWKDCGSYWREVNSHATTIIALSDLFFSAFELLTSQDNSRLVRQIVQGCDYIAICQDKAFAMGLPEGAIIHEIPNHLHVIPGDIAQSVVAFAKASRMLTDVYPEKSREYLDRAVKAYKYLMNKAVPMGDVAFSRSNHGAHEDFKVPAEWQTRDLLMMIWGGVELWINGRTEFKAQAIQLARDVISRQVPREKSEDGLYGHFYTFNRCGFTEKASVHHHFGHDTGGTFPHYLIPLMEMCGRWYDHPDAELWRKTVLDFAYGYFLPTCSRNPFYIIPEGVFGSEGLLVFCGPWHGINTTIGFASVLATWLEAFTGDRSFRKIAVGNIQWIAGLNAGITRESFQGCLVWKEELPEGMAVPYSQIHGIGRKYVGCWTNIKGTIPNGFNVNPQFQLLIKPTRESDGPWLYTDEDWIPHSAGWMAALTQLRERKKYTY